MNFFFHFRDAQLMGTPSHPGWWTWGQCCWDDSFALARVILWGGGSSWPDWQQSNICLHQISWRERINCVSSRFGPISCRHWNIFTSANFSAVLNRNSSRTGICWTGRYAKWVIRRRTMIHQTGILGKHPRDQVMFRCPLPKYGWD